MRPLPPLHHSLMPTKLSASSFLRVAAPLLRAELQCSNSSSEKRLYLAVWMRPRRYVCAGDLVYHLKAIAVTHAFPHAHQWALATGHHAHRESPSQAPHVQVGPNI